MDRRVPEDQLSVDAQLIFDRYTVSGAIRMIQALPFRNSRLYELMGGGELPFVKLGRSRRIPRRAIVELAGRPRGSRPRLITALRDALDEDDTLERLRRVAIERMEAGDPAFWKMLLDRVWPAKVELSAETETVVEFRWAERESD